MAQYIFDLDGTLTDPREGITRCYDYALRDLGLTPPSLKELEKYIGPPALDVFQELLQTTDMARVHDAIARYRVRYADVGLYENFAYPGIHQALEALQGHTLWVCTSKPHVFAEPVLKRYEMRHFFKGVYGPELDGTRADKRVLLRYLIEREGLDPSECVMIGDRMHDIRAAKATGTRSLGVLYGFGDRAELEAAGADAICATTQELPQALATVMAAEMSAEVAPA